MKKQGLIVRAVIAAKGNLPPHSKYIYEKERDYKTLLCTSEEFNDLVDELASNLGNCKISYQEHCSNEVTRLKGNEMNTITHKGNIYQIGRSYEFSSDGDMWELGVLDDYTEDVIFPFRSNTGNQLRWFQMIRLQQVPVGTITEAPVELVDGEYYQFDYGIMSAIKGGYDKKGDYFWVKGSTLPTKQCTDIKPLTIA